MLPKIDGSLDIIPDDIFNHFGNNNCNKSESSVANKGHVKKRTLSVLPRKQKGFMKPKLLRDWQFFDGWTKYFENNQRKSQ